MSISGFLATVAACYLVLTLTATSLAKLRRWRGSSLALIREQVIPIRAAPGVIIGVALAELALATLMMLRILPAAVGIAAAILFTLFGSYRFVAALRTRSLMCPCTGIAEYYPATPQAIAAAVFTCLFQIGLAITWAAAGNRAGTGAFQVARVVSWGVPFIVLLVGGFLRSRSRAHVEARINDNAATAYPVDTNV